MRKVILICLPLVALSACTEYQGRKTNCWTVGKGGAAGTNSDTATRAAYSPSLSFAADPNGGCIFEPLD